MFWLSTFSHSYDSEGKLTNVTFPSGVVVSLLGDAGVVSTVEMQNSEREEEAGITANRSAIQTVLTLQQGEL